VGNKYFQRNVRELYDLYTILPNDKRIIIPRDRNLPAKSTLSFNTVQNILSESFDNLNEIFKYILDQQRLIGLCLHYINRNINSFKKNNLLSLPKDIRKNILRLKRG